MDILCELIGFGVAAFLLAVGMLGCLLPVIPGPFISYAALFVMLGTRFAPSASELTVFGIACAVVTLLDYVVPALGAKKFNCSRWGVAGCVIGTAVGMFFGVLGIVLGPFLGAVAGEIAAGKNFVSSMRGGFGAFLGFVFGVLLKIAYCVACAGWCVAALFR